MSDFFGALELELRAAADRRPRRRVTVGQALGGLAAAALLAAAVAVVAAVSGGGGGHTAQVTGGLKLDPVGTVIPKGQGYPPRAKRSVVVATGRTRYAGPWQLEIQGSERLTYKGEVIQPAGLTCVYLYLLDPPDPRRPGGGGWGPGGGGYCGDQRRTPGFTRGQADIPMAGRLASGERVRTRQVLIYGRAPERAEYIRLTVPNGLQMQRPVYDGPKDMPEDYYVLAVPPRLGPGARITWLDENKQPASPGARALPTHGGEQACSGARPLLVLATPGASCSRPGPRGHPGGVGVLGQVPRAVAHGRRHLQAA